MKWALYLRNIRASLPHYNPVPVAHKLRERSKVPVYGID
jgi:hypothetical protein